jgi:hypothetical protein
MSAQPTQAQLKKSGGKQSSLTRLRNPRFGVIPGQYAVRAYFSVLPRGPLPRNAPRGDRRSKHLQAALQEKAVIDLVPLAQDARRDVEAAVADFRKNNEGIQVDAQVLDLRLVGVEFDATTLRVIGAAEGTARAGVRSSARA